MSFRYYEPEQVGGMLVYEGSRRQRGGNLIGTLGQVVAKPLGRFLANRAKAIGKDVAKRSLRAGVGAITDKIRGGPNVTMKEALKRRAAAAADKAVVDYLGESDKPDVPFISQDSYGLRRTKRKATKKGKGINKMKSKQKKRKTRRRRRQTDIFA